MDKKKTSFNKLAIMAGFIVIPLVIFAIIGSVVALLAFIIAGYIGGLSWSSLVPGIIIYGALLCVLLLFSFRYLRGIARAIRRNFGLHQENQRLRHQAALHRLYDAEAQSSDDQAFFIGHDRDFLSEQT